MTNTTMKYENQPLTDEQYAQLKKQEYKRNKLRQQQKVNTKSQIGFGYDYKPIQFIDN